MQPKLITEATNEVTQIGRRRGFFPEFAENCRMLDGGDAGGDAEQIIKQTMIHQETMFHDQLLELHRLYWTQKKLGEILYSNRHVTNTDCAANLLQTAPTEKDGKSVFIWQRPVVSSQFPKDRSRTFNLFDLNETVDFTSDELASEVTSHEQRTIKDSGSMLPAKIPYAVENKSSATQSSTLCANSQTLTSNKAPHFGFDLNMVYSEESSSATLNDTQMVTHWSVSAGSSANSNGVTDELGVPIFSKNSTQDYNFHSMLRKTDPPCTPTKALEGNKQTEGERSEEDTLSSRTNGKSIDMYNSTSCTTGRQDVQEQPLLIASEDYRINQTDPMVTNVQPALQDPDIFVIQEHAEQIPLEKVSEIDNKELEAAEIITSIRLRESSAKPQYSQVCIPEVRPMESEDDKIIEKPQYSSDSLESIVLALPECHEEECSSPAWWRIGRETFKDDSRRFKTRSGRRLHDFQRDILPGMVSLSRQEICEDLHSFAEIRKADEFCKKVGKGSRAKRSRHQPNGRSRRDSMAWHFQESRQTLSK